MAHEVSVTRELQALEAMDGQVRAYEDRLVRIGGHGDSEVLDRALNIRLVEDADEDA